MLSGHREAPPRRMAAIKEEDEVGGDVEADKANEGDESMASPR